LPLVEENRPHRDQVQEDNYNDMKILRIKPNKTVETAVAWTNGNPRGLVSQGDGWLVGTTTGLYRYTADWQGERLTFAVSHGLAVTPDGRIVTSGGGSGLFNNAPDAINTAAKLAALDTAIGKATNWLLNDANVNTNSHLDVAFRLMGMGAARDFYANQPLAASLLTKTQQADTLLRSRQRSDGGWGRNNGNVSDSMVTAIRRAQPAPRRGGRLPVPGQARPDRPGRGLHRRPLRGAEPRQPGQGTQARPRGRAGRGHLPRRHPRRGAERVRSGSRPRLRLRPPG
jgi:hypothetical protein